MTHGPWSHYLNDLGVDDEYDTVETAIVEMTREEQCEALEEFTHEYSIASIGQAVGYRRCTIQVWCGLIATKRFKPNQHARYRIRRLFVEYYTPAWYHGSSLAVECLRERRVLAA